MKKNIKRIHRDLKIIEDCKYEDILLEIDENNIYNLKFMFVGPKDTPFEGGFFYFVMDLTPFPFDCPKIKFLTPDRPNLRLHPNLYANGKVCLSILGTWGKKDWSPQLTIEKIIITIQALLDNNPLSYEPKFYKIKEFDKKAICYNNHSRLLTLETIPVLLKRKDLPSTFHNFIVNYVNCNKLLYLESLKKIKNNNIFYGTIHHKPRNLGYITKLTEFFNNL